MKVREVQYLNELARKYGTSTILETLTGIALGIVVTDDSAREVIKYVNSLQQQETTIFSILNGASNSSKEYGEKASQLWDDVREKLKEEAKDEEDSEPEDVRHDIPKDDS